MGNEYMLIFPPTLDVVSKIICEFAVLPWLPEGFTYIFLANKSPLLSRPIPGEPVGPVSPVFPV